MLQKYFLARDRIFVRNSKNNRTFSGLNIRWSNGQYVNGQYFVVKLLLKIIANLTSDIIL